MGASSYNNGDSYPYTIVEVISPRASRVTRDSYKVLEKDTAYKEGPLECEFTTNWNSEGEVFTKRKNGRWILKGSSMNAYWLGISIGHRSYSHNPHF